MCDTDLCVVRGTPEEDSFDVHRALTDKDSLDKRKREVCLCVHTLMGVFV